MPNNFVRILLKFVHRITYTCFDDGIPHLYHIKEAPFKNVIVRLREAINMIL